MADDTLAGQRMVHARDQDTPRPAEPEVRPRPPEQRPAATAGEHHGDAAVDPEPELVADLREAVARESLEVAYQPIIETRSRRPVVFEALARWRHPARGMVPPDEFIPLAERHGLIAPLTRGVLRQAATACAGWRAAGHDVGVAVNLSVHALETDDVDAMVTQELAAAGIEPRHLVFEITEGALATGSARVDGRLTALEDLGVRLSIDDFGTGYSALSYLKNLPVEEIKIDRSFVRDITTDARDVSIVRSMVRLAHSLSRSVVAEGVETVPALELLAGLGCDFAQGYGIARPMPGAEVDEWLARHGRGRDGGGPCGGPCDLLIVEDSRATRAQLIALAAEGAWEVRAAGSAEEALEEIGRSIPDVVILDHQLPGLSGVEAVPLMRERGLDGPILLFTQFLTDALPTGTLPRDVWPVSKASPEAVFELLDAYRATAQRG